MNFNKIINIIFWFSVCFFIISFGFLLDPIIFFLKNYHTNKLDYFAIFLTEKFPILIYCLVSLFLIKYSLTDAKKFSQNLKSGKIFISKKLNRILTVIVSFSISAFFVTLLKIFFNRSRPFIKFPDLNSIVDVTSASFPSGHTTLAFSVLIPFFRISKILGYVWLFVATLIGLARIYEGVHFPSDILAGILLGGFLGKISSHPETKKKIISIFKNLEFRRQSFHFFLGILIVFFHYKNILSLKIIGGLIIFGCLLSALIKFKKIPILLKILKLFDRPRDKIFPGRGAIYLLMGVFFSLLFFPKKIAYASILIMSVGDSLNHVFDYQFFHKVKNKKLLKFLTLPWNNKKNWIGVFIGIMTGFLAAQFFVPLCAAFLASFAAIFLETFNFKIGKFYLDDNLVVPIVAGVILSIF